MEAVKTYSIERLHQLPKAEVEWMLEYVIVVHGFQWCKMIYSEDVENRMDIIDKLHHYYLWLQLFKELKPEIRGFLKDMENFMQEHRIAFPSVKDNPYEHCSVYRNLVECLKDKN